MMDDKRRRLRCVPDHGHPISSPCEPNGSGELKMRKRNSVLCPFQDYFSSHEMGQSIGGAKRGDPRE